MIELLKRSRYTLGPKFLPVEWLTMQEEHYWIQRKLNHRGNEAFEAKPMHSPRRIHRERKLWAGKQPLSIPLADDIEALGSPSRAVQGCLERVPGDAAFGDDGGVNQHDGDAEVIEPVQFIVGVDIGELGVDAKASEEGQGIVAEVAALAGDEDDLHRS